MKKSLFLSLFIIFFTIASSASARYSYSLRGILIFLDDSETHIEAVTGSLLAAIDQKVGPIIASGSVLANLFSVEPIDENDPKKLAREFFRKKTPEEQKKRKAIALKALIFNENEWIIKEINHDLYLLLPEEYLRSLNIQRSHVEQHKPLESPTDIELQLGLKVNHYKLKTLKDITRKENQTAQYFIEALNQIFCTRDEYLNKTINPPLWTIYMNGHGTLRKTIVHLTLEEFQNALEFFENKINTNLLMYTSCYAAGLNNELIFNDAKSGIQKTYPFAIITQAITDAPVTGRSADVEVKDNQLILKSQFNFKGFLQEVTKAEAINYKKATEYLFPLVPQETGWTNIPQIKLPGVEWFSVMASNKDIVSIGSILAKSRDPEIPLNITHFYRTDPKALLLYAANIPFALQINSENMEAIISMIPGDAVHKFERISSEKNSSKEIIEWFMKIEMLDSFKLFFIKSLNDVKNVIIYNKKIPGNLAFNTPDQYLNYAYYAQNNKIYFFERGFAEFNPADSKQQEEYQTLLDNIEGKIHTLGSFTFSARKKIKFPEISSPTIIETIEGTKDSDIYLYDILDELQAVLSGKGIVWINKLTGKYQKFLDFALPELQKDELVTLNDVVITKQGITFTYNNTAYKTTGQGTHLITDDYKVEAKQKMQTGFKIKETSPLTSEKISAIKIALKKRIEPRKPKIKKLKRDDYALFFAIKEEKPTQELIGMINKDIDSDLEIEGKTLLHHAIEYKRPEVVDALLKLGADVNKKDKWGENPPLYTAIHRDTPQYLKIAQMLLMSGANPNITYTRNIPILYKAIMNGSYDSVKLLLEHNADPNTKAHGKSMLYWATQTTFPEENWRHEPKLEIIKLLREAGAEIDFNIDQESLQEFPAIKEYLLEAK